MRPCHMTKCNVNSSLANKTDEQGQQVQTTNNIQK